MALLKVQPLGYQFKLTARIGPGRRVVGHICVGVVAGGSPVEGCGGMPIHRRHEPVVTP